MIRRLIILLILLSLTATACQPSSPAPFTPAPPETTIPTNEWPDWDNRDAFKNNLLPSHQEILGEMPDASIYRLDLTINSDMEHIDGYQAVRYTNRADSALDEIQFHLFPNVLGGELVISSASIDGETASYENALSDSVLRVMLSTPLQPQESTVIELEFRTTVPTELTRNYGIFTSSEGVLALAHIYPLVAVYDADGWATEIPSEQGDVTYAEASFYHVRVTAPDDLVLVASGSEMSHSSESSQQVVSYASGPARDFYLAASSDYVLTSRDTGTYIINSYAPAEMQAGSEMALRVAAAALDFFSNQYAPYPYSEFDIITSPTYALGIEYPGMTAINIDLYDLSANFSGTPAPIYLESTVAHEVGHQWFYNMIGNDQLDEPWLDESLTQFVTWQYYIDAYGEDGGSGFEQALRGRWQHVELAEIPIGLPVNAYHENEYSAIIYGRGALFFEALALEMGSDNFDAFLRDYSESYLWKVATSEDLKYLAEKHCTCDLTSLFSKWIYPIK